MIFFGKFSTMSAFSESRFPQISDMEFIPEAVQALASKQRMKNNPIIPGIKHVNNDTRTLTFGTQNGTDVQVIYEEAYYQYYSNLAFNTLTSKTDEEIVTLICKYIDIIYLKNGTLEHVEFKDPFKTWMSDSCFKSVCTEKMLLLLQPIMQHVKEQCNDGKAFIVYTNTDDDDVINTVLEVVKEVRHDTM